MISCNQQINMAGSIHYHKPFKSAYVLLEPQGKTVNINNVTIIDSK